MKERPVIFNGEMVRAIIDGRKTQTRRVMKVQPKPSETRSGDFWFSSKKLESMVHVSDFTPGNSPIADCHLFFQEHCCPFGQVGGRLWVRETFGDCGNRLVYRADTEDGAASQVKRWVLSIHMPREACRILLEITAVRVERLNDISEEDAKAEGAPTELCIIGEKHYMGFRTLWKSIYGEESWSANPWVWVIEFKQVSAREVERGKAD